MGNIECGFSLKPVHDMIIRYSQKHGNNKSSQHRSIIWPVWLKCLAKMSIIWPFTNKRLWVPIPIRYGAFFKQGFP